MNSNLFKGIGAGVRSLAVFIMLGIWLVVVARYVGVAQVVDSSGKVTLDKFGNAKDILLALLPLATISLGYWYGSQGTTTANTIAATATEAAGAATKEASAAHAKFAALLDQSQPGALAAAKLAHPEAFTGTAPAGGKTDETGPQESPTA